MGHTMTQEAADREKRSAALSSVAAAVVLTLLKIVVGVSTNSLGILSEAAHSGLDLVAAAITYMAVRYASSPADKDHPFGHGKMENLSALVEALLLLVTCVWIIYEAVDRLFFNPAVVSPSYWALGVMVVSIVIDYSRSRMLLRVAKKHRSQALEADALHFSTDIWSSCVVIVGLVALFIAGFLPEASALKPWLERADSLAAIGVSFIIIHVSISLGKQAIDVLLDAGDTRASAAIYEEVQAIPAIKSIQQLRVRHSGPKLFVELTASIDNTLAMAQAKHIQTEIETRIKTLEPYAEVTVQLEGYETQDEDDIARIRGIAAAMGLPVHAVEILDISEGKTATAQRIVQLHIEMSPAKLLADAHATVKLFEDKLHEEFANIHVITHIEPFSAAIDGQAAIASQRKQQHIQHVIAEVVAQEKDVEDQHKILVHSYGDGESVSFHCCMPGSSTVEEAHEVASRLQAALHMRLPEVKQVIVHMEPIPHTSCPL